MKPDLTRLPVGEMLIGFLLVALAITFVGAFSAVDGGEEGAGTATGSPTASPGPTGGSPTPGGGILVTMGDNFFEFEGQRDPAIEAPLGEQVTFDLVNNGTALHNMHIAGSDNKYDVQLCKVGGQEPCSDPDRMGPGDTATITFQFDQPGTFDFRCDFHTTQMTGKIEVGGS